MKKLINCLILVVIVFFPFSIAIAQEWFDATHLFEEETKYLADNFTKETKAEYDLRTRGIAQYVDEKPLEVGDEITFNTFNIPEKKFEPVVGVLKKKGIHCYVFLEKGKNVSQNIIEKIAKSFDEKIYPINTSTFGSEWNPGIDGDPRIVLFLLDIRDGFDPKAGNKGFTAGYFYAGDEYSKQKNPTSNEREMLYLDINPADPSKDDYMSIVAHEFQHMIHWHHDPKEFTWVNEGMSQFASFINGFGHPSQVLAFLKCPDNNLCAWSNDNMLANYGQVYLFTYYTITHATSNKKETNALSRAIVSQKEHGTSGIEAALKKVGEKVNFSELFRNFCVANYLNYPSIEEGEYGYEKPLAKLRLSPMKIHQSPPFSGKGTVKCWSSCAVEFDLTRYSGQISVNFSGQTIKAERGLKNSFDVAAILFDRKGKQKPIVEWLNVNGNKVSQALKKPAGSHPSLLLVICNRGPEEGTLELAFAKAAPPAEFAYTVTVAKNGTSQIAAKNNTRLSRRTFQSLVQAISKKDVSAEDPKNIGNEADIFAETSLLEKIENSNSEEALLVDSVQTMIQNGDFGMLTDFFELYNSSSETGKKNLESLRKKILDMIRFEVSQNHRNDLKSFLEP